MNRRGADKSKRKRTPTISRRALEAYAAVCAEPGITKRELARALGISSGVESLLAGLEQTDNLISEDGSRLYPHTDE